MSDNGSAGNGKGGKATASEEAALSERLRALGSKLDKAEAEAKQQAKAEVAKSGGMQGMGFALRVASEFASGVLVGAGLGWLIDRWLGTSPWGLIGLLLLGFAAGVLNVLRAVGKVAQPEERVKPRSGR
ncbi:MAG TPA: AtpZ/AtpI family protein [Kaistia sp.]|nr:AtpZ/AtpI family protein [Kaistia sp.]